VLVASYAADVSVEIHASLIIVECLEKYSFQLQRECMDFSE
jgi:hypothetical protein